MASLSPSQIKQFNSCPHQWYRLRVLQDVEPMDSEAAMRGRMIHEQFENAALGRADWPAELPHVERWYRQSIRSYPSVAVERPLALDQELHATKDWENARVRGIADLILWNAKTGAMRVVDYKTGRKRPDDAALQMKFYALACFEHSPKVLSIETDLYWVATDEHTIRSYTRRALPVLRGTIDAACKHVEFATEFPRRKSGLCRGWCPVTDCRFWRPARDDAPILTFT